MTTIADKVHHVLNAPEGDGRHRCHWPGCQERCKPAFFTCRSHWFALPKHLRAAIWQAYQTRQEETKTPSVEYLKAATAAITWAAEHEREKRIPGQHQESLDL